MRIKTEHHYRIEVWWNRDLEKWVGTIPDFKDLKYYDNTPKKAFDGIMTILNSVIMHYKQNKLRLPSPSVVEGL